MYMVSAITILGVFAAGLVVGWNVLPQPEWIKTLWAKITQK